MKQMDEGIKATKQRMDALVKRRDEVLQRMKHLQDNADNLTPLDVDMLMVDLLGLVLEAVMAQMTAMSDASRLAGLAMREMNERLMAVEDVNQSQSRKAD